MSPFLLIGQIHLPICTGLEPSNIKVCIVALESMFNAEDVAEYIKYKAPTSAGHAGSFFKTSSACCKKNWSAYLVPVTYVRHVMCFFSLPNKTRRRTRGSPKRTRTQSTNREAKPRRRCVSSSKNGTSRRAPSTLDIGLRLELF